MMSLRCWAACFFLAPHIQGVSRWVRGSVKVKIYFMNFLYNCAEPRNDLRVATLVGAGNLMMA